MSTAVMGPDVLTAIGALAEANKEMRMAIFNHGEALKFYEAATAEEERARKAVQVHERALLDLARSSL